MNLEENYNSNIVNYTRTTLLESPRRIRPYFPRTFLEIFHEIPFRAVRLLSIEFSNIGASFHEDEPRQWDVLTRAFAF